METALQKMIKAVENGYNQNKTLWNEWKDTLLAEEQEQLKHSFLCGDNAPFHYQLPDFRSFNEYWEFMKRTGKNGV